MLFALVAVLTAAIGAPGTGVAAKLTGKERRATQISSVQVLGEESLGILVTARFGGDISDAIGRGHLRRGSAELVLRPSSPGLSEAHIATAGGGVIGKTVAQTSSTQVGVVRDGQTLTFFDFGPGFSNVATAEVRVNVPGGGHSRAQAGTSGEVPLAPAPVAPRDESTGQVPVPKGGMSCVELTASRDRIDASLVRLERAKKATETLLDYAQTQIQKHGNQGIGVQVVKLINKVNPIGWVADKLGVGRPPPPTLGQLQSLEKDLRRKLDELVGEIESLTKEKQAIEARLAKCNAAPAAAATPPPCTATLERSPGTPPYTATNHIRVRANCTSPIKKINVQSLSSDTFDACAQTSGTGTGCTASAANVSSTWNGPANEQEELYGRVLANADGTYQVTILGAGDAVLTQFQATVP